MSSHIISSSATPSHSASARAVLAELLHHPLAGHWPAEFQALLCVNAARLRGEQGQHAQAGRWLHKARALSQCAVTLREIEQLALMPQ